VNDIIEQSNSSISSLVPDLEDIPITAPFNKTGTAASVEISTDKTEYVAGETMLINIMLANPTEVPQYVYFAWRLDLPEYGYQHRIRVTPLHLPGGGGYKQTVTIPFVLGDYGFPFNASWYVALYDTTTLELISEDFAVWKYVIPPPPTITNVGVVDLFQGATIDWWTDVPATSQVEYGKTPDFSFNTTLDEELWIHHFVRIDNLEPNMIYFFRVKSKNAVGVETVSDGYTFATYGSEEITVNFTNSTYEPVTEKQTGWFETCQDADIVLGLNDFGKASPTIFNHPMKIATDGERLILADAWNNRVLIWNSSPTEINQPPDLVIGQKNLNSSEPGLAADKLNWPVGVATDGQCLLVADTENDRVLIWNEFPTENGEPADLVLGAPNFTTMGTGIGVGPDEIRKVFEWPWDVFTDGTRVMVTSTIGGRVLIWNEFPTENYQPADVLLTYELGLRTPRCAYFDGQHLLIGDYNAENTFVWNELPQNDDEPYDYILWKYPEDPTSHLSWAISYVDGKLLTLIGKRVLIWNEFPTNETDAPDNIFGEVDFGRLRRPGASPTAASFEATHGGMVATADHLFISCYNHHRVLIYDGIPTSKVTLADVVLGATDFETNTHRENYADLEGSAPCSDGEHLFVGCDFGRRLFVYKKLPNESVAKPDIVYENLAASGVTVYENKLIIAARGDAKVYIWNELPLNGEMPDIEIGPEFDDGTKLMQPWGVAADENYLFVSDIEANKIFVWEGGVPEAERDPDFSIEIAWPYQLSSDGEHLAVVIREPAATLLWNLPLDKEDLSPDVELRDMEKDEIEIRFNGPQGVFIDGEHLFVGDTAWHRVFIWNEIPTSNETPPDIVLGQENFEDTFPHTTRDGLFCPSALSFDGNYLWVGEFKFSNRLMRFPVVTGDTTPPVITNVSASNITLSAATITWFTDESATSQVEYGNTTDYGLSTPVNKTIVTSHRVTVSGLEPNTTYHFRVKSKDASCNGAVSGDCNFTTTPLMPPTITDVTVVDMIVEPFSSVTVGWWTDVPATSQLEYGKTPDYGFNTTLDEELKLRLLVELSDLELETVYFFRVKSRNAEGAEAVSKCYTFATWHSEEIAVNFTGSTYEPVTEKLTGWFETGQDADIVLGLNDFGKAMPTIFNHPMKIATDGERLILADAWNNRVLIWNSIPTEINQPPDLVIGQKDLNSSEPGLAADKLNWPAGVATDGQCLLVADTENSRVLIWNDFPTESGEPADLVLGAPNFTSCYDGPLPSGTEQKEIFLWPWDVFTDGTRVIVTSTCDGRVLIWNTFPTENFQPADVVLTQEVGLRTPRCAFFDGQHLLVGDYNARKTFVWNELPQNDDEPYNFTLWGGPEFAWAISSVDGKLLTLMYQRVFIWNEFPLNETDEPDIMLGQVDFGGAPACPTAASFEASSGGMVATTDHLFISCFNQNRVLIYNAIPTFNITLADVVLGAPDFETNTLEENYVIQNAVPCSDGEHLFVGSDFDRRFYVWKKLPNESLAKPDIVYDEIAPFGVATCSNKLVAVDAGRKVLLIWNNLPLNGEMPDIEFGGVAADENYLFVSDSEQNKIFVWEEGIPNTTRAPDFAIDILQPSQLSSDGEHLAATSIEGRAVFIWNLPLNKGNLAPDVVIGGLYGAVRFNQPMGVFIDGEHLFVGDTAFSRVLIWNEIPTSNETPPDIVLGQENFEDTFHHTTRDGLFWTGTLSFDGSYLWVGEFKFSNRLVRFPVH
jgi:hypothetical protein